MKALQSRLLTLIRRHPAVVVASALLLGMTLIMLGWLNRQASSGIAWPAAISGVVLVLFACMGVLRSRRPLIEWITRYPNVAALWTAAAAVVIGIGLEVAYVWDQNNSARLYAVEHPGRDYFCAPNNGSGTPGLFLAASVVILLGGILCFALVLRPRSRGNPRKGLAIGAGVIDLALSVALFAFNVFVEYIGLLACGLG